MQQAQRLTASEYDSRLTSLRVELEAARRSADAASKQAFLREQRAEELLRSARAGFAEAIRISEVRLASLPTSHPTSYPTPHPTSHPTSHLTPHPTSHPTSYPTPHPTSLPTPRTPTSLLSRMSTSDWRGMQHSRC